jgi:hypothetical protein
MRSRGSASASVELYWIPLGAGVGGTIVRWSGRAYESLAAALGRRPRQALFHSALEVRVDDVVTVVEMAPAWTCGEHGVVAEGAVGLDLLGRWELFRYEVRRWPGGCIPDLSAAVGGAIRISEDRDEARRLLELVPSFPTHTWGRDALSTGDMWNSNSLVSWLLVRAGLSVVGVAPPAGGRAPGWTAGIAAATCESGALVGHPFGEGEAGVRSNVR